jgi:undecaprenyl-phosphate 4-deoxy-4-formamido-L-arabinose transferase
LIKKPLVSVVIPSYNDREIILPYYETIVAYLDKQNEYDFELVYVDDGSSDGSQETLKALAKQDSRVTYVELFRNYGQQRALFAGLSQSRGDYAVTLDGDYQYEPDVILQLLRAMGDEYDLASGIRRRRRDSIVDVISSRIGNAIITNILKIPLQDFGSVKAFSRRLVDRVLEMRHYYSDVHPTALSLRPKIIEIEVDHRERLLGKSHWNIWMRLRLYVDLHIAHKDDQFQKPFQWGAVTVILGVAGGAALMLYKALLSHQMTFVEIGFSAFAVIVFGFALMAWSLTMSFLTKIYKQNVFQEPYVISAVYGADDVTHRGSCVPRQSAGGASIAADDHDAATHQ